MFLFILRIILIWWLVSVIFRWINRLNSSKGKIDTVDTGNKGSTSSTEIPYTGEIEDADFDEIDNP
ncbi:MAG TPA: hypothetical protein VMZ04_03830 [Anaerolineae bacterium]|nr:hypothetical protein [Anaerolineae bacterium]